MTARTDLLDDVEKFLKTLGGDLTKLHVAAVRVSSDPADREALGALVDTPGALIDQAQALLARSDGSREPKAADVSPDAPKRRRSARK